VSDVAPTPAGPGPRAHRTGGAALLVAAGILLSRAAGFVRQRVLGHYLGISAAADAYGAAIRIPNILQNLLGEGVLSASFIPVYAGLRAKGNEAQARRVAGAVAGLLTLVIGVVSLAGVAATPWLIDAIARGFHGDTRALAIELVRIFFPSIALLVLSAFCIGVLNSHHRFFLGYAAPVAWSAAIIAALILGARTGDPHDQGRIAVWAAWGAVAGGALQLLVQAPAVVRLLGKGARPSLGRGDANVAEVMRNFLPVVAGRGVVQLSAYIDTLIASWLPGAVAAFGNAQLLYTLPVSLFGMSVSAASLPSMSTADDVRDLHAHTEAGLRTIAFPVVPSVAAFLGLGDVICAALFQTGRFTADDVRYVWIVLAGSTVGLLAATMARLYASAFYASRDTRTPLRYAVLRVALTAGLGVFCGLYLPGLLGVHPRYGAAGLTASAGVAAWVELLLLRRAIERRIGRCRLPKGRLLRLWISAGLATAVAFGLKHVLPPMHPIPRAMLVLAPFGVTYVAATLALRVPEASRALARVRRLLRLSPS
jgi:putative peptidoglycan lipid II flippase